ncbi:MAG: TIGR02253 family HAD-type hydrolase [Miltoncostaeaceae bacterium]
MAAAQPLLDIVFFDIDDTLYSTTEFAQTARRNSVIAMVAAGLQLPVDEVFNELTEVVAEFSSNYGQHYGRLLDRLGPASHEGYNRAVVIAAGVVAYHRTKEKGMRLLPDVLETLARLARAGVRLGVISAGLRVKQAEKLIRLDALSYFDPTAIFFSDQMGVSKPNPKIFSMACAAVDVAPARALYVGDRPTHDIAPAGSIGMQTVHYTGAFGAHRNASAALDPDFTLEDLTALPRILREDYGLPL